MTAKITADVRDVLARMSFDDNQAYLPAQLEPKLYRQVNAVLEALGGKWNRRAKAHLFDDDPQPLIAQVITTGDMPERNPWAFWATPKNIADLIVERAFVGTIRDEGHILEPSAGEGALLAAIMEWDTNASVEAVEIDPTRANKLRALNFKRTHVTQGDFLSIPVAANPPYLYDRVVMNPPFAVKGNGQVYIDHILHAYTFLAPGGMLVSVAPSGWTFRQDKKAREFRAFVAQHGISDELPIQAFKESGTEVNTTLVILHR